MAQHPSGTKKTSAALKVAQEKAASSNLLDIVHKGHALIRVSDGKEEIVATCLNRQDAAAIYAVLRAFYAEKMDEVDDEDQGGETNASSEDDDGGAS